jgi:hypothetical protein
VSTRAHNERKYGHWDDLPWGGRRYCLEVSGRHGWGARYYKEVDADEMTLCFWQEIVDEHGTVVEVHQKYPVDLGHRGA